MSGDCDNLQTNSNQNAKRGGYYNNFNINDMLDDYRDDPPLTFEEEFGGTSSYPFPNKSTNLNGYSPQTNFF